MSPNAVDRLLAALSEVLGKRVVIAEEPKPEPPEPEVSDVPLAAYHPKPRLMKAAPGTLESLKAPIVAAQKRGVLTRVLRKLAIDYGACVDSKPALNAMPPERYAEFISAVEELPATRQT